MKKRKKYDMAESRLQRQIVKYIRMQYKNVIIIANPYSTGDFTKGQKINAAQMGFESGQPDLILIRNKKIWFPWLRAAKSFLEGGKPRWVLGTKPYEKADKDYCGLALELKKDGEVLFLKRRKLIKSVWGGISILRNRKIRPWKSDHLIKQLNFLIRLKKEGMKISFGIGFKKTKSIIDKFMRG